MREIGGLIMCLIASPLASSVLVGVPISMLGQAAHLQLSCSTIDHGLTAGLTTREAT
jgi:hypothetical protein